MAKGVQISTCPRMTVRALSGRPICRNTTSSDTATMISGSTSGNMIKPRMPLLPGNRYRAAARAAQMPNRVDTSAVMTAILTDVSTAACSASTAASSANQPVVKPPSGKAITVLSLNAKIGNNTMGRYRNTR